MRFFKSFRLLHRRTKSEGDVITVLTTHSATQTTSGTLPVQHPSHQGLLDVTYESTLFVDSVSFTPPKHPLPIFDPVDLYAPFPYATPPRILEPSPESMVTELEAELTTLRAANRTLKADLVEIAKEAADARTALYAEMTKNAHLKHQAMIDTQRLQIFTAAFAKYKTIDGLLARIGLDKAVLEEALAALEDGGKAEDVVMDAIKRASARADYAPSGTATIGPRTPEQYAAVLNMTLRARKELKINKKLTKFWKRVAQRDGKYQDTITPSPSDISSIHEQLSPERQKAVEEVAARRREILTRTLKDSNLDSAAQNKAIPSATRFADVKNDPSDVARASIAIAPDMSSTVYADVFTALPPLASESIKRELAQHSSSKRFQSRPSKKLSVLRPVDLNIQQTSTTPELILRTHIPERRQTAPAAPLSHRRHSSSVSGISFGRISRRGQKSDGASSSRSSGSVLYASMRKSNSDSSQVAGASTTNEGSISLKRDSHETGDNMPPEYISFPNVTFDNNAVSDSLESSSDSRFLEHVTKTLTPTEPFQHGASLGHISEESVIHDQDSTFATPTTGPTTPSETPKLSRTPNSSPTQKSKLPVLKYLRRLSPLSGSLKRVTSGIGTAPSVAKKPRARSSSSPTPTQRTAIPILTRRPTVSAGQKSVDK